MIERYSLEGLFKHFLEDEQSKLIFEILEYQTIIENSQQETLYLIILDIK